MRRGLRLACVAAATAGAAFAVLGFAAVRRPLAPRSGTFSAPGLSAPVTIAFDARGIPHVRGDTERDCWLALGWLHAAERPLQLELRRRAATGRLSEAFGPAALALDREARFAGHARRGAADLPSLPPIERAVLDAYVTGINARLAAAPRPLELVVLGIHPEPWTPEDVLAFGWSFYAMLSDARVREERLLAAIRAHGVGEVVRILRLSGESDLFVPDGIDGIFDGGTAPAVEPAPSGAGSNAFAVSGGRSAAGAPLLASDPHLPAESPATWYLAHLTSGDGLDVAGLTLPGSPGVFIGHNGRIAWGVTMQQADDSDLVLERQNPPLLEIREETIAIRGGESVRETFAESARGPFRASPAAGRFGVSWAWAARAHPISLTAFLDFDRARDAADLARAASRYVGPPINVVWAEAAGAVGMLTAGAVPVRTRGDGRLPTLADGETPPWSGTVPFSELPRIDAPEEGFVASGNDDWSASGRPLPYPGHYAGIERVERLREVLSGLDRSRLEDLRALQNDVVSLWARRVSRDLARIDPGSDDARRAVEILAGWDGRVDASGPAALFFPFLAELRARTFAGRESRAGSPLPAGWDTLAALLRGEADALWDDPGTPEIERRDAILRESLEGALREVEREDGPDPGSWSWGRRHRLSLTNPVLDAIPLARALAGPRDLELDGEWHTPRVAGFSLAAKEARVRHIASARILVDLADPDRSRAVLPLGQSGQIGAPNRFDHLDAWIRGEDHPFPFTRPAVDRESASRLTLAP